MAGEVELKITIKDIELEFEGGYNDMVKFYEMIKRDFLDVPEIPEQKTKSK